MLRATTHAVGTTIASHPAQGRGMPSVAYLPQPQEEGSQEETLYRRHAEVPELLHLPAGRDPSLQPLSCVHPLLFRFNAFQDSYGFLCKRFKKIRPQGSQIGESLQDLGNRRDRSRINGLV